MSHVAPLSRKLTRSELRRLRKAWERVPPVSGCKGLCKDSCANVPLHPIEAYLILETYGGVVNIDTHPVHLPVEFRRKLPTLGPDGKDCRFLSKQGRCTIYENRPLVCRMFGHRVLTLTCRHGCTSSPTITEEQSKQIMREVMLALDGVTIRPGENWYDAGLRNVDEMEILD